MQRRRKTSLDIVTSICSQGVRPNLGQIPWHPFNLNGHSAAKYSHAAVWGLIPGYVQPDETRHYPTVAMVANLAKPTSERPALMTHDGMETLLFDSASNINTEFISSILQTPSRFSTSSDMPYMGY